MFAAIVFSKSTEELHQQRGTDISGIGSHFLLSHFDLYWTDKLVYAYIPSNI